MQLLALEGCDLECEIRGVGEPVLLIHGSCLPDAFLPLAREPALAEGYRVIRYRRRGYGASTRPSEVVSMAEQARDAAALLRHLGIERAHVVGHSLGGSIALQLALDRPGAVHSLALLEPLLLHVPSGEAAQASVLPALELFLAGDKADAVGAFLELLVGPDWQARLETALPGATARAIADADALFVGELLALGTWPLRAEQAEMIAHPVLSVVGERLLPLFREVRDLLHEWMPQTEDAELFGASHFLQIEEPEGAASILSSFFARHPLV